MEAAKVKPRNTTVAPSLHAAIPRMDSDGKLAVRAEARLRKSGYHVLQNVVCEAREGLLVLRGRVGSYYMKQLAQEVVRPIEGVEMIVNALEVRAQHAP